jgi:phospholipid/cholesterol/gamma-HCH transport system ATP-binding protein
MGYRTAPALSDSKRAAIGRAVAAKPNLLLLDDPTTGLDPVIASTVDDEIVKLRDLEHATSIVVTSDPRRVLHQHARSRAGQRHRADHQRPGHLRARTIQGAPRGRIFFEGSGPELLASQDAYLKEFLFMTLPPW